MTVVTSRLATGLATVPLAGLLLVGCAGTPASTSSAPAPAASSSSTTTTTTTTSTTTTTTPAPKPTATAYTLAMVAQHATATSCWSVVNKNVYDLTAWINAHPGGASRIKSMCGRDATADYTGEHGTEPEPAARLASFKLGPLS